ncbi:MAG: hypothetical protein GTO45_01265 [Candidatus Aminicenantes bacterium]|nr:hypothetical protein [Candidatus Aminicenantes bacterium]NIM77400.1 hypothetical protein [Candidatus Aminicenantes bacterium]NIN16697.1 hypothetical protein [Candidatus Aminicenantes bacterium]NIN40553.1 hypothetical protein [Candidatus Aminicenantes bacterium]NIN83373.1 hypothetical protein [Candidatus Aminicenantes bacterium]
MKKKDKKVEPIPDEFASYREAGEFWDTHDTTDYLEDFVNVDVDVQLRGRRFEIDIDEDVMELLKKEAKRTHMRPGRLASQLLRRDLKAVHGQLEQNKPIDRDATFPLFSPSLFMPYALRFPMHPLLQCTTCRNMNFFVQMLSGIVYFFFPECLLLHSKT